MNIYTLLLNVLLCTTIANYTRGQYFQGEEMGQKGQLPEQLNYFVANELVNFDGDQTLNNIDSIEDSESVEHVARGMRRDMQREDQEQEQSDLEAVLGE